MTPPPWRGREKTTASHARAGTAAKGRRIIVFSPGCSKLLRAPPPRWDQLPNASTHKEKTGRANAGAGARAHPRPADRDQEGCFAGRAERERRVSHGEAAPGLRQRPAGAAQEAYGGTLPGQPDQYSQGQDC